MHAAAPTPSSIRSQLDRILQSEAFRKSAILSRFLRHVVEETLDGHGLRLKEYSIALQVLSRNADFNPQNDAIVRIHAGRLRRTLEKYYQTEGVADPVHINIPKGSYVAEFSTLLDQRAPAAPLEMPLASHWKVKVAVLPFLHQGANKEAGSLADGIGDAISTELTRYPELGVISYYSCRILHAENQDIKAAGESLGADFIVTGSVSSFQKQLRISIQLSKASTREQIWAETYDRIQDDAAYFNIQHDIAWQVVSQTAGHFGAISRNLSKKVLDKRSGNLSNYNTLYWYYNYVTDNSAPVFHQSELALTEALRLDPDYALGWAILGEVYVGGHFNGYKSKLVDNMLDMAILCGKRALKLNPLCQHGFQTLALAHAFRHEWEEGRMVIKEWEKIKPGSPGVQCVIGFVAICLGQYEMGMAHATEGLALNPFYPWFVNAGMCFYYFHIQEFQEALAWAERMNRPETPWWFLLKGCCFYELGNRDAAAAQIHEMFQLFPQVNDNMSAFIRAFLYDRSLTDQFQHVVERVRTEYIRKGA
jgi:TolB-like protein